MFLKSLAGPHLLLRRKVLEFGEQGKNLGRRCEQPGGDHNDGINDEIYDDIGDVIDDGIDDEINDNDSSLDKHGDPGGLQLSTDSLPLALQQEPLSLAQAKGVVFLLSCCCLVSTSSSTSSPSSTSFLFSCHTAHPPSANSPKSTANIICQNIFKSNEIG